MHTLRNYVIKGIKTDLEKALKIDRISLQDFKVSLVPSTTTCM